MKNIALFIFVSLLGTICLSSCSDGSESEVVTNEEGLVLKKFKAVHDKNSSAGTRTALKADGETVVWQSGEQIGVFDDGALKPAFTLDTGAGEAAGTFVGYANPDSKAFYAVSPYRSDITIAGSTISGLKVKARQTPKKGTYDPEAAVMTSYTTNTTMMFYHVCSFIKVVVDDCNDMKHLMRISIETKNAAKTGPGRDLAGIFDATIETTGKNAGLSSISNIRDGSSKITMDAPVGEVIEPGTYYFAILPGDIEHLEVRFETVQKSFMRRLNPTTEHKPFNRAEIRNLGQFPNIWTWTEEKKQEVIYSGNYKTSDVYHGGKKKQIFFAAGNLQAVMSGDPDNPIKEWRLAEHQYDYVGLGTDQGASSTGNFKVSKGGTGTYAYKVNDVVDMFAWVADKNMSGTDFTTDPLLKYGITNLSAMGSGTTSNYLDNNKSASYNDANSCADWAGAYKTSSRSKRTWQILDSREWNNILTGRTDALGATTCTVTTEDNNTVFGFWIYPSGSSAWGTNKPGATCKYDDYLEWIAKGCMFFPSAYYISGTSTSLPSAQNAKKAYYWASNAITNSNTGNKIYWDPYQLVYDSGLKYATGSVNQRCFVRLYTEATITAE